MGGRGNAYGQKRLSPHHFKDLSEAKTYLDFHKLMSDSGVMGVTSTSGKAISRRVASEVADAMDEMSATFPQLEGILDGIAMSDKYPGGKPWPRGCYACSMADIRTGKSIIYLNPAYFSNYQKLASENSEDVLSGWSPMGTDSVKSLVEHEIAHAIDHYAAHEHPSLAGEARALSIVSQRQIMANAGLDTSPNTISHEISRYATEDNYEWYADAMCEGVSSARPRKAARAVVQATKNVLNGKPVGNKKVK